MKNEILATYIPHIVIATYQNKFTEKKPRIKKNPSVSYKNTTLYIPAYEAIRKISHLFISANTFSNPK